MSITNMSRQDVEFFQSFVRRYVNKAIREHFNDISNVAEDSLSLNSSRQATKKLLLHKDTDTMTLTLGRLLFWWIETKGLLDEYIYGIPSTDFEISNTYYPQVKLHFTESRYEATSNNRRPVRSEISFRWREENYTTAVINSLVNKIVAEFVNPVFRYDKGRECWTYWDSAKGYRFTLYTQTEADTKSVIEQVFKIQDDGIPNWEQHLRKHEDEKNYNIPGYVIVNGERYEKPKLRPLAKIEFAYAELFIPGTSKALILVDRTGRKKGALRYA